MPDSIGHAPSAHTPTLSLEFFPPKTARGGDNLWRAVQDPAPLAPDFVSVTYGAGGSTRDRTLDIVRRLRDETALTPVMHLTCVGADRADLLALARQLRDEGIGNVLALRGDPPDDAGGAWTAPPGGLADAADLVARLRALGCDLLAAGAPGLHFYTLNRAAATREVCARLHADGSWRRPVPFATAHGAFGL